MTGIRPSWLMHVKEQDQDHHFHVAKVPLIIEKVGNWGPKCIIIIAEPTPAPAALRFFRSLREILHASSLEEAGQMNSSRSRGLRPRRCHPGGNQEAGHQPNISFFAFTATPKARTLETFGTPGKTACQAFYVYSPCASHRRRIRMDVLGLYSTYRRTYFRLSKKIEGTLPLSGPRPPRP